jgi:hypothetical protein
MGITDRDDEVVMAKSAAQLHVVSVAAASPQARIIDIRTGRPWRPPEPAEPWRGSIFLDMFIIVGMVSLGAWLFLKMQGG